MSSTNGKDHMQVARICFLIIYLRLSFRHAQVELQRPSSRQLTTGEQRCRNSHSAPTEEEQTTSAPITSQEPLLICPTPISSIVYDHQDRLAAKKLQINPQQLSRVDASWDPSQSVGRDIVQIPERHPHHSFEHHTTPQTESHFGNITISGNASAHLGDLYKTCHVANTNIYSQHDTLRIGLVAGTTAAMMSQILSAALAPVTERPSLGFIGQTARQVSSAVRGDSWVQEYEHTTLFPDQDRNLSILANLDDHRLKAEVEVFRTIVPIVAVEKTKRRSMTGDHICEPLQEVIDLVSKRAVPCPSIESLRLLAVTGPKPRRNHQACLNLLAEPQICLTITEFSDCQENCPIIHIYGNHSDLCCILFPDDHFTAPGTSPRSALIIFNSKDTASQAMKKWRQTIETDLAAIRSKTEFGEALSAQSPDRSARDTCRYHLRWSPACDQELKGVFFAEHQHSNPQQVASYRTENGVRNNPDAPNHSEERLSPMQLAWRNGRFSSQCKGRKKKRQELSNTQT